MRHLLIRGAEILASAESAASVRADILCRDGRIVAVESGLMPPDPETEILDAESCIAIPGLINAHLHSSGNLQRGTLDGLPLEIFMLYEVPPLAAGAEDPRIVRLRTLIGAVEMLKLGITSVLDDAFFVPLCSTSSIDAIAGAYRDVGMRATIGLDQPIVVEYEKYPFLKELLPEEFRREMERAPRETAAGMAEHYRHLIDTWHGAGDGRIAAAVSCSAPQRATPDYLQWLAGLARRKDLPFFCHVLETKLQRVLGQEKYGRSLVRYLDDLGVLDERCQVIHGIWIDDDDIAILARSGATVAHNPVCNLRLGSGVMPFRKLRDAGVPICLGTDEAVSDDSHNLWGAIKLAGLVHTLAERSDARWPKAPEILDCLWNGGSRVMRREYPLGRIEPRAAADIALLDRNADAFTPLADLRRQLVYNETGSSVRHTVVDGRVVVRDRCITTLDEAALKADIRSMEPALAAATCELCMAAQRLEPYYRAMVERAHLRDVGFTRWLG
jgi:5-methylthioadenosine/S-adenosylhomocysteine deaminase